MARQKAAAGAPKPGRVPIGNDQQRQPEMKDPEGVRPEDEERLRESEERFRVAQELSPDGFSIFRPVRDEARRVVDFTWVYENPTIARLNGTDPKAVVGRRLLEVFPGHRGSPFFEAYREAAEKGQPQVLEAPYRGDSIVALTWFRVAVVSMGTDIAVLSQDITVRKQAEEALREAEERLRTVLRATGVGLWLHELPAGGLNWDPQTRELFFIGPEEELTADLFWSRVHPDDRDRMRREVEGALRENRLYAADHRTVDPATGRVRWIHAEGKATYDATGRPVRFDGINYDITDRKEFQAELERLVAERTAKLQELVGELEHFSYTITHDLKAPLRAMRGFAEVAGQVCGETEARPFLEKISAAAERMDALIRDALNYSRTARQELPLEDVDTGVLLRGILDSYPDFQPSKAKVHLAGPLPVVLGNEAGLTQCFSNLLGNAVKFVRPGEVPEIRIWAEERAGWSRIWFGDKGIGIPGEMLPRVFDMFSRASRDYEGTGIGLALVRKVVQRMGGRAGVESEVGKGSRFWIELKSGEERPGGQQAAGGTIEPKGGTVLYVEDEDSDVMFMERAFAGSGLASALRVVGDGRAAIEYLSGAGKFGDRKEYPLPGVVVLDLNLPAVPGFEVLRWMRNHPDFARTPVVVFSSSTRDDDRTRARELGASEFVAKPNSGLEFGRVVQQLKEKWMI